MSELKFYKHRRRISKRVKIEYAIKISIGVAVALLGVFFATTFCKKVKVTDTSMAPTIEAEQTVCIDRLVYKIFKPKQNEIIAFAPGGGERAVVQVKRIIAVPGDKVIIKDGAIYINDKLYNDKFSEEPILNAGIADSVVTVGENEYFVLGDNRNNSEDSRFDSIRNVSKEDIVGKVWFRSSPIFKLGFL